MPNVRDVIREHNRQIDSFVAGFEKELQGIVASAEAHALGDIRERLDIVGGKIAKTAANQRVLRQVDDFFNRAMKRAGYDHLVEEFVAGFAGQLPYFEETLEAISAELDTPLKVVFTAQDKATLQSQQLSSIDGLRAAIESAAASAKREALMSVGALKFTDLAQSIAARFARTISEASTLAETSMVMYYRTITDRGFAQIENGLPEGAVRYRFQGPDDKITRPFCHRTLERSKTHPMTRAEIERLNNGQLPNPFITGGGWNCRHQWIISELKGEANEKI